jgi:hypothetical protein
MQLSLLTSTGQKSVGDAFFRAPSRASMAPDAVAAFSRPLDVSPLLASLEAAALRFGAGDDAVDAFITQSVHEALPLTRREAADKGLWHWLGVFAAPDFVRHRWTPKGGVWAKERFLGGLSKNTFARMWWIAELTRRGSDYTLTRGLLERSQDLVQLVYEHKFGRCPRAVDAFLRVTADEKLGTIRELAKALRRIGATMPLELLTVEETTSVLDEAKPRARRLGNPKEVPARAPRAVRPVAVPDTASV